MKDVENTIDFIENLLMDLIEKRDLQFLDKHIVILTDDSHWLQQSLTEVLLERKVIYKRENNPDFHFISGTQNKISMSLNLGSIILIFCPPLSPLTDKTLIK